MFSFAIENQTDYISKMSEDEKIAFLRVLVHLAEADGNFDDNEKAFVKDIAFNFGISESKTEDVFQPVSEQQLISDVSHIKDRQAALQLIKEACLLANSDGDLSEKEVVFIGKVGQAMGVELEKIEQISQWVVDRIIWLEEGKIIFEQL